MACIENEYSTLIKELEDAKIALEEVVNTIHDVFDERMRLRDNPSDENNKKGIELLEINNELYKKESALYERIRELEYELYWILPPIKTNGVVEIRKQFNGNINDLKSIKGDYSICLANKQLVIGKLSFRGYHCSTSLGDIGCAIERDYRGHGYAYQSTCLLLEYLKENNIEDVWVTVSCDNIPSIKTIEKFGGVPLKSDSRIRLYQAPTFIMEKECEGTKRS